MGQHQRPGLVQKIQYQGRHAFQVCTLAQVPGLLVGHRLALLGKADGVQTIVLHGLVLLVLLEPDFLQLRQGISKKRRLAGGLAAELFKRLLHWR